MIQASPLEGVTSWARPRERHRQGHGASAYFLRRILRILVVYHQPRLDSGLLVCLLTAYVGLLAVLAAGCRAGETPLFRPSGIGLGANQLLEDQVALLDGSLVIATCSRSRGRSVPSASDPGHGVVFLGTWKAYPAQKVTSHSFTLAAETPNIRLPTYARGDP